MHGGDLADSYNAWHEVHQTGDGPWYELVRKALGRRPEALRGARALEVGCGQGTFCGWLADHGAERVLGIEFSSAAVRRARASSDHPAVRFEVGDIQDIGCADGSFDLVVSCETIEHVPDLRRALRELARVLRPGGTLLLSTPNYASLTGLHRLYRTATGRGWDEGGQPLCHWTFHQRTLAWVRTSGLRVLSTLGSGWYLPVKGRPGGVELRPPLRLLPYLKPFALHVVIEALKVA